MRSATLCMILAATGLPILSCGSSDTNLLLSVTNSPARAVKLSLKATLDGKAAAATQGRIKIEFTGSSLAAPPRQFELVSGGGADLAFSFIGYNPDRFPRHNILSLPMLGPDAKGELAGRALLVRSHDPSEDSVADRLARLTARYSAPADFLATGSSHSRR